MPETNKFPKWASRFNPIVFYAGKSGPIHVAECLVKAEKAGA